MKKKALLQQAILNFQMIACKKGPFTVISERPLFYILQYISQASQDTSLPFHLIRLVLSYLPYTQPHSPHTTQPRVLQIVHYGTDTIHPTFPARLPYP